MLLDRQELLGEIALWTDRVRHSPDALYRSIRQGMRSNGVDPDTWVVAVLESDGPIRLIVVSPADGIASFDVLSPRASDGDELEPHVRRWRWDVSPKGTDSEYVAAAREYLAKNS